MPIFLFLKQIVDMLYQYKILDYAMVIFGVLLLCHKIWKDKIYLQLKEFICVADLLVIALACVYVMSFLRYPSAYGIFFKVESVVLLYFLGRVYGQDILRHGTLLAGVGYGIIYANFLYRFYQFGFKFVVTGPEETLLNRGGFYYYKTDLAVAILIAMIFIYLFSEKKFLKWFTIVPVCGYMVLYSGARMQKIIIIFIYACMVLSEIVNKRKCNIAISKRIVEIVSVAVLLLVVVFFVLLQCIPYEVLSADATIETGAGSFIEKLMHSRHIVWREVLEYFTEQPLGTRLFGIDLETEYLHNAKGIRAHSFYIKQLYATGYVGCLLVVAFLTRLWKKVAQCADRKIICAVVMLWMMFLGSGISIESMESTQMSWFPFLFAGVLISQKTEDEKDRY